MPTLIDSLVVSLGLDSKDLTSKTPAATKQLKDVEQAGEGAEKSVKKLGSTTKETSSSFSEIAGTAAKFLAVIGGAAALKAFISDFIETNAQLKRFSDNIGESVNNVSAWGQAAEQFGGSASGLQGTLDGLGKAQTQLRLTGESSLIPYLAMLGVSVADVNGKAKSTTELLADIGNAANDKIKDRTTRNNLLRSMGIDQGTANLLMSDRTSRELLIKRIKEQTAVTDKQAEAALKLDVQTTKLKQGFAALGRSMLEAALPMLEKMLGWLTRLSDWISANSEFVQDFLKIMAVGLGAIALASIPIDLVVIGVLALAAAIALLWQDYQTWKRGGDSLIDWDNWKPEIDAAIAAIGKLGSVAKAAFEDMKPLFTLLKHGGDRKAAGQDLAQGLSDEQLNAILKSDPGNVMAEQELKRRKSPAAAKTDANYMMQYFMKRGLSKDDAAGIAANLMTESGGKIDALGDHGMAYGLAQWHPDRQRNFKKFAGHDIRESTIDEQLGFVMYEMQNNANYRRALGQGKGGYAAGAGVSKYYEAPKDTEGEMKKRGDYAASLAGTPGSGDTQIAGNTIKVDNITVVTQATNAKEIAADIKPSFDYLFTSQANAGLQ